MDSLTFTLHFHCPRLGLYAAGTPPDKFPSAWDYFNSIPEWQNILQQNVPGNGELIPFIGQGANPKSPRHDQLVGNLLQRPDGVRHVLSFFIVEDEKHFSDPSRHITETHTLFALGPGLAGHAGLVHGGMIMTLFDEGLARIIEVNWAGNKEFILNRGMIYTAAVNIKFKRPLPIDSEVCVTATLLEHDDQLLTIVAEMRGPKRELYATAEALWRNPKPKASL